MLSQHAIKWIEKILQERFYPEIKLTKVNTTEIHLTITNQEKLIIFDTLSPEFTIHSLYISCACWDAKLENWQTILEKPLPAPGFSNLSTPLIEHLHDNCIIHYDILGLTYWMLSRHEEIGRTDLDNHGRFPAKASHAYLHGYLERPIVDEWLHILGQVIQFQWPNIKLKQHQFNMRVSHDVDNPSRYGFLNTKKFIGTLCREVLKKRDINQPALALQIRMNTNTCLHPADPYNNFNWIMDVSEKNGLKSAFYFICGRTNPAKDADYELEHLAIRELIQRIHKRGHEIGLHPSYDSYKNPPAIATEANRLKRVCREEGIDLAELGGRMHYLRWETPSTLHGLEQTGMTYDCTLGYADHVGFRCGTCHEYPAFDPVKQQLLSLRIRPLIAMDCTLTAERYMGLNTDDALATLLGLKRACFAAKGSFTLLWHNCQLITPVEQQIYESIISSSTT